MSSVEEEEQVGVLVVGCGSISSGMVPRDEVAVDTSERRALQRPRVTALSVVKAHREPQGRAPPQGGCGE